MATKKWEGWSEKQFEIELADSAAVLYGAKVVDAAISSDGSEVVVRLKGLRKIMGSPYVKMKTLNSTPLNRPFSGYYEPDHSRTVFAIRAWFRCSLPAAIYLIDNGPLPGQEELRDYCTSRIEDLLSHRGRTAIDRISREAAAAIKVVDKPGAADAKATSFQMRESLKLAKKHMTLYLESGGNAEALQKHLDLEMVRVVMKS